MLRLPLILSLLLFLGSCGFFRSPDKERCRRILPREKVTDVLIEIYLMDSYLSDRQTKLPTTRDSVDFFFASIYTKHEVSYDDFKKSLDCYLLRKAEMDLIHEEILNRLSIKQSEAEAELERFLRREQELLNQTDSLSTDSVPLMYD